MPLDYFYDYTFEFSSRRTNNKSAPTDGHNTGAVGVAISHQKHSKTIYLGTARLVPVVC